MNAFLKSLDLDPARLSKLTIEFSKVFKQLAWDSDDQMLPTPAILTEKNSQYDGLLLAIDVGGSHLRVGLFRSAIIVFGGEYQVISEHLKSGTAEGLFDYIGERIADVLARFQQSSLDKGLGATLPAGITFSFPMM